MRHLICIILLWIIVLPVVGLLIFTGLHLDGFVAGLTCGIMAGFFLGSAIILTKHSWKSYKASGHKLIITLGDIYTVLFYIAGASAVVAVVTALVALDAVTVPALWVFASAGALCFLLLLGELLLRKD